MARNVLYAAVAVGLVGVVVFAYRAGWLAPTHTGLGSDVANPTIQGTFVSSDNKSVTIATNTGKRTYALAADTKIVSQVKTGETGLMLADFPGGALVLVRSKAGSSVAESVALSPQATEDTRNPIGPPMVQTGTIVAVTDTLLTIKGVDGEEVRAVITKDTRVLANVLAGQPGKSLTDLLAGPYVQVHGYVGTSGFVADTIQLFGLLQ